MALESRPRSRSVDAGENVFPAEVDGCLLGHDAVADVATLGVPDDEFGERLRSFVVLNVLNSDANVTPDELRDHLRANLARYKVPRDAVVVDSIPRNLAGKVVKRRLPTEDGNDSDRSSH